MTVLCLATWDTCKKERPIYFTLMHKMNIEEKEGLDHRVKSMLDTVKKVTDSSRKSALGEVDASADQPDAGGVASGIRKYDDLLSRIKGQLKVVGNM